VEYYPRNEKVRKDRDNKGTSILIVRKIIAASNERPNRSSKKDEEISRRRFIFIDSMGYGRLIALKQNVKKNIEVLRLNIF